MSYEDAHCFYDWSEFCLHIIVAAFDAGAGPGTRTGSGASEGGGSRDAGHSCDSSDSCDAGGSCHAYAAGSPWDSG